MNIVLLGPPASGKGTISEFLTSNYNFLHVSMGDLLRQYVIDEGEYSDLVKQSILKGEILQEDIASQILKDYLTKINKFDNILLDGFPRGMISKKILDDFMIIDLVIVLELNLSDIKKRILNRLRCTKCGKVYSIITHPTLICDECHGKLEKRVDDNLQVLEKRMMEFQEKTVPVIESYERKKIVVKINAKTKINEIFQIISETIEKMG